MEHDDNELLTLDEAAMELKVSRGQIHNLIRHGRLPYVSVGTGTIRIAKRIRRGDLNCFKNDVRHEADLRIIRRLRSSSLAGVCSKY